MPPTRRRFSILRWMAIVSIVAVDCGLLRNCWDKSGYFLVLLLTIPTLNLMILNAVKLRRGQPRRLFWVGFDAVGLACFALILLFRVYYYEYLLYPVWWLGEKLALSEDNTKDTLIFCTIISGVATAQLCILGWLVGSFFARYRLVLERRSLAPRAD